MSCTIGQLIVYLNDVQDKKAKLFILDKDEKKILKKVTPNQYKGVCYCAGKQ